MLKGELEYGGSTVSSFFNLLLLILYIQTYVHLLFMYLITNYCSTLLAVFQNCSSQLQLKHHGVTAGHKLPWSKRCHIDLSFC